MALKSTCTKLQYDPHLISVACPKTELSVSGKFWVIRKSVVHRKSLEPVLSSALHREPLSTILAFSVNDPLPDLPKFLRNG